MVPIFEQGNSVGIGLSYNSFIDRFREICQKHYHEKRAKAFALIFYNFENLALKKVLKSNGGFAQLDRLSGHELSVFYLHTKDKELYERFNATFKYAFDVEGKISIPFVLFLKFDSDINEIVDMQAVSLEQNNYLFAFEELFSVLGTYINNLNSNDNKVKVKTNKVVDLLKNLKKLAVEEFIKLVIRDGYQAI